MEAGKHNRLASFLVDSGICSPQDIEQAGAETPPDALLDSLVEQGRLSADQSFILKRFAESPWFDFANPDETVGDDAATTGASDFRTYWAGEPLMAPEQRYIERTQHAKGGMGRVIRAFDMAMRREVAIKELLPEVYHLAGSDMSTLPAGVGANQEAIHRFLNEARITGQLEHPAIVPVYEIGSQTDGAPYYTMKLVRGQSLADAIRAASTLPERLTLLPHFIDLCQAIAFAHSRGVIHRDIKPSNVLLGEYGETLVIDWGLAKMREQGLSPEQQAAHGQNAAMTDSGRTMMGQVLGTPMYMAPEQARGALNEIDERSDVYSLGVVLYEILVGKAPFASSKPDALLAIKQQESPPPVRVEEKLAPPDLAAICERALDRDPNNRYQSAVELAEDVERFMAGSLVEAYQYSVAQQMVRFARKHKLPLTVAALATVLIVIIGATSYLGVLNERDAAVRATQRESIARADAEDALLAAETARAAATASEERVQRELYFSTIGLANTLARSGEFTRARQVLLETPPALRGWEWSWLMFQTLPDEGAWPVQPAVWQQVEIPPRIDWTHGRFVLHTHTQGRRGSHLYDLQHRTAIHGMWETHFVPMQGAYILPDGQRLIQYDSRRASLVAVDHYDRNLLAQVPIYIPLHWTPAFSTDGRLALFAIEYREAAVFDTDDLRQIQRFECEFPINNALLLASTQRVLTAHQPPFTPIHDEAQFTLWDIPSGEEIATFGGFRAHPAAAADDGRTVALTGLDGVPIVFDVDSHEIRFRLDGRVGPAKLFQFAPEANAVLVARESGAIDLYDLDDGTCIHSWTLAQTPCAIAITPDAHTVAVGCETGKVHVFQNEEERILETYEGRIRSVSISPGAERIAVIDEYDLRISGLKSNGPIVTLDRPLAAAAFSADGYTITGYHPAFGAGRWSARTGGHEERLFEVSGGDEFALMGPGGDLVLVLGTDSARLVRVSDGITLNSIEGHDFLHAPAAFSPDGAQAAVIISDVHGGGARGHLALFHAADGSVSRVPLRYFPAGADPYYAAIAFDPSEDSILVAHTDGLAHHNRQTGEVSRMSTILPLHAGHSNAAAVSPAGEYFVASGSAGSLVFTNAEGQSWTLPGHSAQVTAIAFDAAGGRMVTGAADGTLKLWDAESQREVLPLPSQGSPVTMLQFNPTCGALLVGTRDGATRLLHVLAWGVDVDAALPGVPAAERWSQYRRLHPLLAHDDGLCDVAAQERLLTALGYSREEALGVLAPVFPISPVTDAECDETRLPANRLFLHTIAGLVEREHDPGRRASLTTLAADALKQNPLIGDTSLSVGELIRLANELLMAEPPRARAALAIIEEGESRLLETGEQFDAHYINQALGAAYAAAGEWRAAHTALARVYRGDTDERKLLWAEVHANLDTQDEHRVAIDTLETFLLTRDPNYRVKRIHAQLMASPYESIRERAEHIAHAIKPDPTAIRSLPWRPDLETALDEAAENEGIVFAFVESSANPANMLEARPELSRPDTIAWFAEHSIPVLLDSRDDPSVLETLGVTRLPALIAMNRNGDIIDREDSNFTRRNLYEGIMAPCARPGVIRAYDIAGPFPDEVTDPEVAKAIAAALNYPEPLIWNGNESPWTTCLITEITKSVQLSQRFNLEDGASFVATATIHAAEETPVSIRVSASDTAFLFINGELKFAHERSVHDDIEPIRVKTTLPAGNSQLVVVLSGVDFQTRLQLVVVPEDEGQSLSFGPVLNERFPQRTSFVETIKSQELPPETFTVHLHKDELLSEWRLVNADFMRSAEITFVEVDGRGLGVRLGNASEFAVTRKLGLRDGDICVSINDIPFSDPAGVIQALEELNGQIIPEWTAVVIRGGREVTITLFLDYD